MSAVQAILMEIKQEAPATRRLLERIPEAQFSWQPHPKAMNLGQLALHLAQTPSLVAVFGGQDSIEVPKFEHATPASKAQVLETFEQSLAAAETALTAMPESTLAQTFRIERNGKELMAIPKGAAIRAMSLNHGYHHRGQLSTYLRTLDVALPVVYGQSADENAFG